MKGFAVADKRFKRQDNAKLQNKWLTKKWYCEIMHPFIV
jgi:hypothetical protein